MHRFVVSQLADAGTTSRLGHADAHHAAVVLRLREGDEVELLDGRGTVAAASLTRVGRECVEAVIRSVEQRPRPRVSVGLAVAMTKGKAWDWTLQKCTEAGVSTLVPVVARRSVVRVEPSEAGRRREEWSRTVEEACKQCGVAWIPDVLAPVRLEDWVAGLDEGDARWVAALEGERRGLMEVAHAARAGVRRAWVAVGPEGDWDRGELALMRGAGFSGVKLGPNVMRAETAALAAVVLMRAALDVD